MTVARNVQPQPFAHHQVVELEISTLTNLGVGLGRMAVDGREGWVVMVPFALPGERVRARVWRNHAAHSQADLLEVLRPSPQRRAPVCPLFGTCGGCQSQHLSYQAQLQWKRQHVADALQRLASIEAEVLPVVPSPREYAYRAKLTPHHPRPRPGLPLPIGFLRAGSRQLLDVPHCALATPALQEALTAERQRVQQGPPGKRGGTLLLRDTGEMVSTRAEQAVEQTVGAWRYRYAAGGFFQVNPFLLPALVQHVVTQACDGMRVLVDAYCGVGLFSLAAAEHVEQVIGVETVPGAIADAEHNAAANHIGNCRFLARDAEQLFADLQAPPEATALILDPPRQGCSPAFLEQLLAFSPQRVVYVSCDPATQARDLKALLAAYCIVCVQPFDMFPQTRHIENVVTLVRQA